MEIRGNEDPVGVYSTFYKQIVHNSLYHKQASLRKWQIHMEWNHFVRKFETYRRDPWKCGKFLFIVLKKYGPHIRVGKQSKSVHLTSKAQHFSTGGISRNVY